MENNYIERIREVKRSFRLIMDGQTAQSMREKGVNYHVNWGASLPMLKAKAGEIGKDYELAKALWKEDVRECKILATLCMPADEMPRDLAELWMEQTTTQEMAELAAMNLYQHLPYSAEMAFRWIALDKPLYMIAGFSTITRLMMQGLTPDLSGAFELKDQAMAALQSPHPGVAKAALNALNRLNDSI